MKFQSTVTGEEATEQIVHNFLETKKLGGNEEGSTIEITDTDIAFEALELLNAGSIIDIVEKVKASGVFDIQYHEA